LLLLDSLPASDENSSKYTPITSKMELKLIDRTKFSTWIFRNMPKYQRGNSPAQPSTTSPLRAHSLKWCYSKRNMSVYKRRRGPITTEDVIFWSFYKQMLRNSWVWSFAKSFSMLLRRLAAYESSMAPFIATLISRHFDPSQVAEESRAQWIAPGDVFSVVSSMYQSRMGPDDNPSCTGCLPDLAASPTGI